MQKIKKIKLSRKLASYELARRSFLVFAQLASPQLSLTDYHQKYYQILDAFAHKKIRKLIVTIPPQHGKSLGSSTLLPAYILGINPSTHIAIASYNAKMASKFNRTVQRVIDTSLFRGIFPETKLKSKGGGNGGAVRTNEEFEVVGANGGLISVGREGSLTGNPVDVFILDDLYKDALEANSPLVRDNAWEWYNAVAKTRLHNDSQELIVFTRWNEDDLIGRLESHQKVVTLTDMSQITDTPMDVWFKLNFEAIKCSPPTQIDPRNIGEALWPQRHSSQLLLEKQSLDNILFETMYQGEPTSKEGLLWGDRFATYNVLPEDIIKKGNYTDTADTGDDYLCSICYEVGRDQIIYITDIVYTPEPMDITEVLVSEMFARSGCRTARIESNNGGRGFARALRAKSPNVHIDWFHQSRNKEARILSNATTALRLVMMPSDWQNRWSVFYNDLISYRRLFRSNRRDDAADALTGVVETETDLVNSKPIKAFSFSKANTK